MSRATVIHPRDADEQGLVTMKSPDVVLHKFDCPDGAAPLGCRRFEDAQIYFQSAGWRFGLNSDCSEEQRRYR